MKHLSYGDGLREMGFFSLEKDLTTTEEIVTRETLFLEEKTSSSEPAFSEQLSHHCPNPLQQMPRPAELLNVLESSLSCTANIVPAFLQSLSGSLKTCTDSSISFYNRFGYLPIFTWVQIHTTYTKKQTRKHEMKQVHFRGIVLPPSVILTFQTLVESQFCWFYGTVCSAMFLFKYKASHEKRS